MNTDKQAMENMEYVRKLLEEKQPGFAASVELALSLIRHQIELPEEAMELTLPFAPAAPPRAHLRRFISGSWYSGRSPR